MKLFSPTSFLLLALLTLSILTLSTFAQESNDDDFLDFDSNSENVQEKPSAPKIVDDFDFDVDDEEDDGQIEDDEDEDELENVSDKDTFEDFGDDEIIRTTGDKNSDGNNNNANRKFTEKGSKISAGQRLRETSVPHHLRENWYQYWIEAGFIGILVWYIFNFFSGKNLNYKIANTWMEENMDFLSTQFSEVGGASTEADSERTNNNENENSVPTLTHNSSNIFTLWCTGRKDCEGMLVEIKLVARQDLLTVWRNKFNRKRIEGIDTITFSYFFEDKGFTEPCILTVGQPRLVGEIWKNFEDLRTFCPKGPKEKGNISANFSGCAENQEMLTHIFDSKAIQTFRTSEKFPPCQLGYIHITDRYESMFLEDQDKNSDKKIELDQARKIMVTSLTLDPKCQKFDSCNFTKGILHIAERVKRMKLSKEVKASCDRRRTKAMEDDQRKMHKVRTEAAAERTELKRREMNRKIMEEEDPDKQRKLYQQQQDRDARKQKSKFRVKMK